MNKGQLVDKIGASKGQLSNIPVNKNISEDNSLQSSIDEENT